MYTREIERILKRWRILRNKVNKNPREMNGILEMERIPKTGEYLRGRDGEY